MAEPNRPKILADIDQAEAVLRDLAPALSTFATALEGSGFSRTESVELTKVALAGFMNGGNRTGPGTTP